MFALLLIRVSLALLAAGYKWLVSKNVKGSMANTLQRPEMMHNNDLREHLRWQKQTTDNIAALDAQATLPPFIAITRDAIGVSYTSGAQHNVNFNRLDEGSFISFGYPATPALSGTALTWSMAEPDTIFVSQAGLYLLQASFGWDINVTGAERSMYIYNAKRFESYAACNGIKGGYNTNTTMEVAYLLPGDTLQLQVYQDSGSSILESSLPRLAAYKLTL